MVGTYKYRGKVVSEKTFKEKVYGKDSKQAQAITKKSSSSKKAVEKPIIVIGLNKVGGVPTVVDLGKNLTSSQKKQISNIKTDSRLISSVQGDDISFTRTINERTPTYNKPPQYIEGGVNSITPTQKSKTLPSPSSSKGFITTLDPSISSGTPNQKTSERQFNPEPLPNFSSDFSISKKLSSRGKEVFSTASSQFKMVDVNIQQGNIAGAFDFSIKGVSNLAQGAGLGVASAATGIGEGLAGFGKEVYKTGPINAVAYTAARVIDSFANIVNPRTRGGVVSAVKESAVSDPIGFTSRATTNLLAPNLARTTYLKGRNLIVSTGSKYVPPENLFTKSNLEGGGFENSRDTTKSLDLFRETGRTDIIGPSERIQISVIKNDKLPQGTLIYTPDYAASIINVKGYTRTYGPIVQTSGPAKLSSKTAGKGPKATAGFEDPGIYVSLYGRGSSEFLRISPSSTAYKDISFSLNPLKGLGTTPTITLFRTKGVDLLPRNVVKKAGFEGVSDFFLKEGASTGKVFITKRSEIGTGNIPRQFYPAKTDIDAPFWGGVTVKRGGSTFKTTTVKKGDLIREPSTTELEGVVPEGSRFAYTPKGFIGGVKGYNEFTTIGGVNVPLRQARLVTGEVVTSIKLGNFGKGSVSGTRVSRESSSLSSIGSSSFSVSPFGFSGYSGLTSSKVSTVSFPKSSIGSKASSSSVISPLSSVSITGSSSFTGSGGSSVFTSGRGSSGGGSSYTGGGSSGGGSSLFTGGGSSVFGGGSSYTGGGSSSTGGSSIINLGSSTSTGTFFDERTKKKKRVLFGISILKKGKFKNIGFASSKREAFLKGGLGVSSTLDRTFKITNDSGSIITDFSNTRFRTSKSQKGAFVEKSKFAINTGGEKLGLRIAKNRRGFF